MTYLGPRVPIQSQQIYFLQTFIISAFYNIFSHFEQNCWYDDDNFNLKTFVLVANALWNRDIWKCEKYDWIRAPYVSGLLAAARGSKMSDLEFINAMLWLPSGG